MVNKPEAFRPAVSEMDFLKENPMPLFNPMEYGINIAALKETPMSMPKYLPS
jgi:hypothetical protein